MSELSQLPESWAWSSFGEIADIQLGRQRSPKNHAGPYMRPYLRAANVTWDGLNLADVKEMNFDPNEAKMFELREGDILLNEASGSSREVGKPAIWRNEIPGCCFQNTLLRLRSNHIYLKYLYWYTYFSAATGRFGEAGRGVNIRHLGKRGLAAFPIPIAPVDEQVRVVAAIEGTLETVSSAESQLQSAAARLGYDLVARGAGPLQLATFAHAFTGRLTEQDSKEETAAELLGRIRWEGGRGVSRRRT